MLLYSCLKIQPALLLLILPRQVRLAFKWISNDATFDCVVGISINENPVGMGVFIHSWTVLTTANPFQRFGWTHRDPVRPDDSFSAYAIHGSWNKPMLLKVDKILANQFNRNKNWVRIGLDKRHTTVFDFITFTLLHQVANWRSPSTYYRIPWFPDVGVQFKQVSKYGWKFAAFGYVNQKHIQDSSQLVSKYYTGEAPFENCDEWFPRNWGYFICLANVDNFMGVQSGAVLLHGNRLAGLGAFELNKGNESILVFTDLKPYYFLRWFTMASNTTGDYHFSFPDGVHLRPQYTSTTYRPISMIHVLTYVG